MAIELAAARLRTMSIDQLVNQLDDRFRLLTTGSRTALPRHKEGDDVRDLFGFTHPVALRVGGHVCPLAGVPNFVWAVIRTVPM